MLRSAAARISGWVSTSTTIYPCMANRWAMPVPMVPEPMTPVLMMFMIPSRETVFPDQPTASSPVTFFPRISV